MKKRIFLGTVILASSIAAWAGVEWQTVAPQQLLSEAKKLVPPHNPYYEIQGRLRCEVISQEVPPYAQTANCQIVVEGQTSDFQPGDDLLLSLYKLKPRQGPAYLFKGHFTATSIANEFPPYGTTESASVLIKN